MPAWFKKHFPRVDKLVDQYGYWVPFLGSVWGGMTWIANSVPGITQYGGGVVAFAGLGVTCLTALAVTASLAMYRFFRPLEPKTPQDQGKANQSDGAAKTMLSLHKEVHDSIRGFENRLEREISARNAKIADQTITTVNLFKASEDALTKVADDLRDQITAANSKIDGSVQSLRRDNSNLADRLVALKTFYEMQRRRRAIDRLILLLDRPLKQPLESRDWSPWGKRFKRFEVAMHAFSSLVGIYFDEEAAAMIRVDPKVYRMSDGDFAPENFPDPGTAHDFKTFRQMSNVYESMADALMSMVEQKRPDS